MRYIAIFILLVVSMVSYSQRTKYSADNSTFSILSDGQTWTGNGEHVDKYEAVLTTVVTDRSGELFMEFSPNNSDWYPMTVYDVDSASIESHRLTIISPYYRVRFVNNSGGNQSYFRLTTMYGNYEALTTGANDSIAQDVDAAVVKALTQEHMIASGRMDGLRIVNKFARNIDVDAAEDIWAAGGDYTGFPSGSAETFTVSSSSANDAAAGTGARTVRWFYFDENKNMFDDNGDFLFFDVSMNGITGVNSTVLGKRIWRGSVLTSGSGNTNEGIITITHTTTTANVFATIAAGIGQTEISNFTIPTGYTGYMKRYSSELQDNTANDATIKIWTQDSGGTIKTIRPFHISTDVNSPSKRPYGGIVFQENVDFVLRVVSIVNANGDVTGEWDLVLEKN